MPDYMPVRTALIMIVATAVITFVATIMLNDLVRLAIVELGGHVAP